jgi:hypothetical protein
VGWCWSTCTAPHLRWYLTRRCVVFRPIRIVVLALL